MACMNSGTVDTIQRAARAVLKGIQDAKGGLSETIVQSLLQYVYCKDAEREKQGRGIAWEIIGCLTNAVGTNTREPKD